MASHINANMKWDGEDIIKVLEINRGYDVLWDPSNPLYMKKNAREYQFSKLMEELRQSNVDFDDAETLHKKLKSFKDVYRSERNKVIKSMKSGAGTDDIYKPKLAWYDKADAFLKKVVSSRESSSNLVSASLVYISFFVVLTSFSYKKIKNIGYINVFCKSVAK